MTFYQKLYGLVTALVVILTAVILFVGFPAPYSGKFILESIAILFSELIFGLSLIFVSAKSNEIMPLSAGYSTSAFLYFFFTLLMAFAVGSAISLRIFFVMHIAGFIIFAVLEVFYFMTEHHGCFQDSRDAAKKQVLCNFQNTFLEIKNTAEFIFAEDSVLIKKMQILSDDFRYAADPSDRTQEKDQEIEFVLRAIKQALAEKDYACFCIEIDKLNQLFRVREQMK